MEKILVLLGKINLPRIIADHLFNKRHNDMHRMLMGIAVMGIGVSVSKIHAEMIVFKFFFDGFGYALHGIGLTPFIEKISNLMELSKIASSTPIDKPKIRAKPILQISKHFRFRRIVK